MGSRVDDCGAIACEEVVMGRRMAKGEGMNRGSGEVSDMVLGKLLAITWWEEDGKVRYRNSM